MTTKNSCIIVLAFFNAFLLSSLIAPAQNGGTWANPLPTGWSKSTSVSYLNGAGTCGSVTNRLEFPDNINNAFIQYNIPANTRLNSVTFSYESVDFGGTAAFQQLVSGSWQTLHSTPNYDDIDCPSAITANIAANATAIRWIQTSNDGSDNLFLRPNITFVSTTLPAEFGSMDAQITGSTLEIAWSTLSENNNDHFNIEASKDGKNFIKIGSVDSKAKNGRSEVMLDYNFSFTIADNTSIAGGGLIAVLITCSLLGFSRRKSLSMMVLMLSIISTSALYSCSKNSSAVSPDNSEIYVRIAQIDKDGTSQFSRIVKALRK